MKATQLIGTNLVHVEFEWANRYGECYECGLPAAFAVLDGVTPLSDVSKRCAVCAANAAANGDGDIIWLENVNDAPGDPEWPRVDVTY